MKKSILLTAAILLFSLLAGCGRGDGPADAAPAAAAEEVSGVSADDGAAAVRDSFVGSWRLADTNDLETLSELFPNAALFGGSMEIRPDGMISWFIGSDGAVGSYEIQGNYLITDVVDELDGEAHHVTMGFQGTDTLIMRFKDVVLVWSYGDSEG